MIKKKALKKTILNYTVIFEPDPQGGFVVYVPALPGCYTQGETLDEAYKMAEDAIGGYIKTLRDLKKEIPCESNQSIIARIAVAVEV